MKKTYIAPEMSVVKVNNVILAGSATDGQLPTYSSEQEGIGGWSSAQSLRGLWEDDNLYEDGI